MTEPTNNLRLWDTLGKTDPAHTKGFKRGGGFSGTAVKPMWINKRLTEIFGPVGQGWGTDKPDFEVVHAGDEILVYCTVAGWYIEQGTDKVATVYGIGGDKVLNVLNSGKKMFDDEAFKKAFTDALGNAFKFVGVAADVHMGLFDDSKYVQEMNAHFQAESDTLGKEADALTDQIRAAATLGELIGDLLPVAEALGARLVEAKRDGEQAMLASVFNARKAALTAKAKSGATNG